MSEQCEIAYFPASQSPADPLGHMAYVGIKFLVVPVDADLSREQVAEHVAAVVRQALLDAPER